MQVKKQQLELDMEQQTDPKLGKEYIKAVYCHPAYLTYMQSTSCDELDESQAGVKIAGRWGGKQERGSRWRGHMYTYG